MWQGRAVTAFVFRVAPSRLHPTVPQNQGSASLHPPLHYSPTDIIWAMLDATMVINYIAMSSAMISEKRKRFFTIVDICLFVFDEQKQCFFFLEKH